MDKTWVAVIAVGLLVIIAAGWVFYATAGAPMLADWLARRAGFARRGPALLPFYHGPGPVSTERKGNPPGFPEKTLQIPEKSSCNLETILI